MAKNYNTRTASLKATIADIRNLDAKQIKLNGNPIVGNVYDLREGNISEYDIWPNGVKTDENGNVTVYPLGYNKLSVEEYENIKNMFMVDGSIPLDSLAYLVKSIKNNKVLDADGNILFYFDTNTLENTRDENSTTRGSIPFYYLESFESDLDNLIDGTYLFLQRQYIKSFKPNNLNKLKTAVNMFGMKNTQPPADGCGIVDFGIDLPELEIGQGMFQYHTTLKSFKSNTPLLMYAKDMFKNCHILTSVKMNLSSLEIGVYMFSGCYLDNKSLNNIIHTINDLTLVDKTGMITIGLGITDDDEARQLAAEDCCCESWEELEQEFTKKGWTAQFQFNGPVTYGLRNPSTSVIWAKLEEETDIESATYTSQDGSKFYNINWYHRSNDNTNKGYTQFASLAEAIENFNVIEKQ